MDDKKIIRMFAMFIFLSSSVTAFALAMMAFTYTTGELPMGIQPILQEVETPSDKELKKITKEGPGSQERFDEEYINRIYKKLSKEQAKLAEDRKKLTEKRKIVEKILEQAKEMQKKINKSEKEIKSLLTVISDKEKKNVQEISSLIAGMEVAPALKMILELDENMASRVLYMMNKKLASPIIAEALKSPDKKKLGKIKRMIENMQRLSEDELKPVNNEGE